MYPPTVSQIDLLKSTALPLMKRFGIDGEGFDLKVRMPALPVDQHSVKRSFAEGYIYRQGRHMNTPSQSLLAAFTSGGEERDGTWWGRRSGLHMPCPQDHQGSPAD